MDANEENNFFVKVCNPKMEMLSKDIVETKLGVQELRYDVTEIKTSVAYLVSKNGNGGNGKGNPQAIIDQVSAITTEGSLVKEARFLARLWAKVPQQLQLPFAVFLLYEFAKYFDKFADKIKDLCVLAFHFL